MEIVPFEPVHHEAAAALTCAAFRAARRRNALLPARWEQGATYVPELDSIQRHGSGVALIDRGRLHGFLAAYQVARGARRWTFTPEWAWGARGRDRARLIQDLYAAAADRWVADGCRTHHVSVHAPDRVGRSAWSWLGFGHEVMDGIRDLAPLPTMTTDVRIRRAEPPDATTLGELEEGLRQHLAGTPVFFSLGPARTLEEQRQRIGRAEAAVLLAEIAGEVVGHLLVGPASDDAATVIRDERTASIVGAFVRDEHRRAGVAHTLLAAAVEWAREGGYERIAVDFETANLLATRFWTRYFQPVTYSLVRRLPAS